ncbi:MAG: family 4 glycosyl hydrolase [Kiritimatiellia bacterium]
MPAVRICVVGGGSPYMTSMFASLAHYARKGRLAGSHVVLHDINERNVRLMHAWATAAAKRDSLPLTFSCEIKLEKALDGADFVLSCFRTGGLAARYLDETIPEKYGELGVETVGVGGVFMALRCIPEVVTLAKAIRRKCPRAWLINYTNPVNMVCDATIRVGHERTIGLCDGVWGVKWLAAKLLKIPTSRAHEIETYCAGVNHHTWCLQLYHKGRNLYEIMDELIANTDLSGKAGYEPIDGNPLLNVVEADACRLYKYYGLLPGSVYYARYYYNLRKLMQVHLSPDFEHRSTWLQKLARKKRQLIREQLRKGTATLAAHNEEDAAHGDQAIGAIHAIANDSRTLETVNVVNHGTVSNLSDDAIVEVACILGSHGAMPVAVGPLPFAVQGMVRCAYEFAKLTVDAALSGDRRLVLQAAMAHPAHRDLDIIEKVIEELSKVHRKWLPHFFQK